MQADSPQSKRRSSLQLNLLAWMLAALALVWGSFVAWGYQTGVHEAEELTDGHLAGVGLSARVTVLGDGDGRGRLRRRDCDGDVQCDGGDSG